MDNQFELPKEGVRIYNPDSGWQSGPEPPGAPPLAHAADAAAHDQEQDSFDDVNDEQENNGPTHIPEARPGLDLSPPDPQDSVATEPFAAGATPVGPAPVLRSRRSNGDRVYTARPQARVETVKPYARPMAAAVQPSEDDLTGSGASLVPQTQAAALAKVGDSLESLFTAIQRSTVHQMVDGNAPSWRDVANISRHLEDRLNTRQHLLKELHAVDQEIRETREDLLLTLNALSEYEQQSLQAASMRASISAVAAKVIAKRFAESGGD